MSIEFEAGSGPVVLKSGVLSAPCGDIAVKDVVEVAFTYGLGGPGALVVVTKEGEYVIDVPNERASEVVAALRSSTKE